MQKEEKPFEIGQKCISTSVRLRAASKSLLKYFTNLKIFGPATISTDTFKENVLGKKRKVDFYGVGKPTMLSMVSMARSH